MRRRAEAVLAGVLATLIGGCCQRVQPRCPTQQEAKGMSDQQEGVDQDCRGAVLLATALMKDKGEDPALYKLVAAENRLKGHPDAAPHKWRLTFKLRRLIPEEVGGIMGAGGELFIEVDTATRQAKLAGVGE